jgi:hypothetical protein
MYIYIYVYTYIYTLGPDINAIEQPDPRKEAMAFLKMQQPFNNTSKEVKYNDMNTNTSSILYHIYTYKFMYIDLKMIHIYTIHMYVIFTPIYIIRH